MVEVLRVEGDEYILRTDTGETRVTKTFFDDAVDELHRAVRDFQESLRCIYEEHGNLTVSLLEQLDDYNEFHKGRMWRIDSFAENIDKIREQMIAAPEEKKNRR